MAKAKRKIQMPLRESETLIWAGGPCEEKEYGRADIALLPLSALSLAFCALFGTLTVVAILQNGLDLYRIIGLAMLAAAGGLTVYAYFFRFGRKRSRKAELVYGVTNHGRVLIRDTAARRMIAYDAEQLADACVTETDRKGTGTIYLRKKRPGNWLDNTGLDFLGRADGAQIALFDVPDCRKVYKLIRSR